VKRFHLVRAVDVSGVSGTGVVAKGVQFPSGRVVFEWCAAEKPPSLEVWDSIGDALEIHGHGGTTTIEWEPSHA
jgi:hypothetical protein